MGFSSVPLRFSLLILFLMSPSGCTPAFINQGALNIAIYHWIMLKTGIVKRLLTLSKAISFVALAASSQPLFAEKFASIIIDDLGNNMQYGNAIVTLPAALTIAILPDAPFSRNIARLASKQHKEVMLHLPMQSVEHHGYAPGMLDLHMTKTEFIRQLRLDLAAVPYVRGINNHMGSLLTRHPGHMSWLMDEISRRGDLYFIDSKTTSKSIADKIASEYQVPNLSRDFFLDPDDKPGTLDKQFALFIKKINRRGYALAIAHPYPATIAFLKAHLDELKQQGITLIPVSQLISLSLQRQNPPSNNKHEKRHVACTGTTCSGL
jgi:polysaccharide deacetylase 2 family uncharacterized protein YibQ